MEGLLHSCAEGLHEIKACKNLEVCTCIYLYNKKREGNKKFQQACSIKTSIRMRKPVNICTYLVYINGISVNIEYSDKLYCIFK